MSETMRDLVIEQLARLRFACSAIGEKGIDPRSVRLSDLDKEMANAYRRQASEDYELILTTSCATRTNGIKPIHPNGKTSDGEKKT